MTVAQQRLLLMACVWLLGLTNAAVLNLGSASTYAVIAYSSVTNSGPTTINGDVAISPGTSLAGFPPGVINGNLHETDTDAASALSDANNAYSNSHAQACTQVLVPDLGGLTLAPGVYCWTTPNVQLTAGAGTLTLNGPAEAVWVFQINGVFTVGASANVVMSGGASACNVIWTVSSLTVGANAALQGNVLAQADIAMGTGTTLTGRLVSSTASVTLASNDITLPNCPTTSTSSSVSCSPSCFLCDSSNLAICAASVTSSAVSIHDISLVWGLLGLTMAVLTGLVVKESYDRS